MGPLRLNLSRSGVNSSVGIKGLRVSTGRRGTYLNAGRKGLYYRTRLSSKKARVATPLMVPPLLIFLILGIVAAGFFAFIVLAAIAALLSAL